MLQSNKVKQASDTGGWGGGSIQLKLSFSLLVGKKENDQIYFKNQIWITSAADCFCYDLFLIDFII